ncbi:acyloxyacyl hydrolase [Geomonas sp. Red69]|uniref:Acyloxyacyl hydrolase n=1 Tax=Geomonas diazotrophica TaxID=2843197 RepID=A0ABX8JGN0_9BACT|nr:MULTISPECIES: acyloxyacyl hydrolase [Geomonas]MBU5635395.1 acyloxyacyl hydrolase [Geomonas diazotrophica]QWV97549.1 acyloxyacyl hydrolase [Geomonas nitrogeniifigens]QXE86690.1 acyloxyacyl hydrolase [Geomonas nitrogeniifigens]
MTRICCLLLIAFALSLGAESYACANSWGPFGVRGGIAVDGRDNGAEIFETFATYQLPWNLRSKGGWGVSTQVSLTAGVLSSGDDLGFIGSVGPAFGIGNPDSVELDLGVSIAVLSRDEFGGRDYNGIEQFISHAGLIYRFTPSFALSYRFQHMSNAGLNGYMNPGLNMHLFGINWYPER